MRSVRSPRGAALAINATAGGPTSSTRLHELVKALNKLFAGEARAAARAAAQGGRARLPAAAHLLVLSSRPAPPPRRSTSSSATASAEINVAAAAALLDAHGSVVAVQAIVGNAGSSTRPLTSRPAHRDDENFAAASAFQKVTPLLNAGALEFAWLCPHEVRGGSRWTPSTTAPSSTSSRAARDLLPGVAARRRRSLSPREGSAWDSVAAASMAVALPNRRAAK